MAQEAYPPLPLSAWQDTKTTLHLFAQVVGKIRLSLAPPVNHWWHVPLYVSARGLTTTAVPYGNDNCELEFDFFDHALVIRASTGERRAVPLGNTSVMEFTTEVLGNLKELGIDVDILAKPFDPSRVRSETPFTLDREPRAYDAESVHRFWRVLVPVNSIFQEFRGRFLGKCSPVHFFWHSFDLAVTRFSGRPAPVAEGADPVTKEAYSHEAISAGFWPGDQNMPEPAFYCYAHPEPAGLAETALRPEKTFWNTHGNSSMAIYRYEDFRAASDPREALLDFLQSSYEAGADLANWPRKDLEV